jgi:RimJ/RimL family protein N-acetyltransferase
MMLEIPTLETPRLLLRPHRLDDFEASAAQYADPHVTKYLGGEPFTRAQSWIRFIRYAGLWHHLGFGYFAVEEKASGKFAGECGFMDLQRGLTPSLDGTMEAGWAFGLPFQGRGYAEEALRACLGWAREHGPRDRITAIVEPGNARSLRLAGKLGFVEIARSTLGDTPIVMFEQPARP